MQNKIKLNHLVVVQCLCKSEKSSCLLEHNSGEQIFLRYRKLRLITVLHAFPHSNS